MRYVSTRDKNVRVTAAEAIAKGLAGDGGLFVPETIPALPEGAIPALCAMDYHRRAVYVMKLFLEDYSEAELTDFAARAYSAAHFDAPAVAPTVPLDGDTHVLELWHGPTCAFKDMALQILPYFLTAAIEKTGDSRSVCILVATSGDTGKAALEGFRDVARTKIMVFYPENGVSAVQKLQMTSQEGENVGVCAVKGNFDDAQSGVKAIFSDAAFARLADERGWILSSANSINWGRLLPQIVYYISAYCDLVNDGTVACGEPIDFCVPTGNFGDILAGYYAKRMGLPVRTLLCASNRNDVLTDFIRTGVYDRNRPFYTTVSPSMDILISSNLERLLYHVSGADDAQTAGYMKQLSESGRYTVSDAVRKGVQSLFAAGSCTDEETKKVIGRVFREKGMLLDTHTAVACGVLEKYRRETGDGTHCVLVSTASPYKFCPAVLEALGHPQAGEGPELIGRLAEVSGTASPRPLRDLASRKPRFTQSVEKDAMPAVVEAFLK